MIPKVHLQEQQIIDLLSALETDMMEYIQADKEIKRQMREMYASDDELISGDFED